MIDRRWLQILLMILMYHFFYLHSFATSKNHQKPSWNLSEGRFLGECVKHRTQHFAAVFNGSNPRKIHIEGFVFDGKSSRSATCSQIGDQFLQHLHVVLHLFALRKTSGFKPTRHISWWFGTFGLFFHFIYGIIIPID